MATQHEEKRPHHPVTARRGRTSMRKDPFRLAVEASPTAIVLVDENGLIVFANSRAEQMFRCRRHELEGREFETLLPGRFRGEHPSAFLAQPLPRSMDAGRDLFAVRQDGVEFPVEIGLNPVETDEGAIALVSIVDISERKQAEERLRLAAQDLARSKAELEQYAHAASHDLKSPLRLITSYLQLLEQRHAAGLGDGARECIQHALQGARHMGQLVDGLLAYSLVGAKGLTVTRFPAAEALARAEENLRSAIGASGAEVRTGDLPVVEADRALLIEVFQNLLGNAIKFCAQSPRIEVSGSSSGEGWTFGVRDNGIGIDAAFAERIFGLFERLHPRDQYPGSGIGLAICRKIVELHGGSIRLAAGTERGSEFVFTLRKDPRSGR